MERVILIGYFEIYLKLFTCHKIEYCLKLQNLVQLYRWINSLPSININCFVVAFYILYTLILFSRSMGELSGGSYKENCSIFAMQPCPMQWYVS